MATLAVANMNAFISSVVAVADAASAVASAILATNRAPDSERCLAARVCPLVIDISVCIILAAFLDFIAIVFAMSLISFSSPRAACVAAVAASSAACTARIAAFGSCAILYVNDAGIVLTCAAASAAALANLAASFAASAACIAGASPIATDIAAIALLQPL